MITWLSQDGDIARLCLSRRLGVGSVVADLRDMMAQLCKGDFRAVLGDITALGRLRHSEMAAIAELVAVYAPDLTLGLITADTKQQKQLNDKGITRIISVFDHFENAANSAEFRRYRLSQTRAIILCAQPRPDLNALGDLIAPPMLDILGHSAITRTLKQFTNNGLNHTSFVLGDRAPILRDHIKRKIKRTTAHHYVAQGQFEGPIWQARAQTSASTLAQIYQRGLGFDGDILVQGGSVVHNVDLGHMMNHHRETGAAITLCDCQSSANDPVGLLILKSYVLSLLPDLPRQTIMGDLLRLAHENNLRVENYDKAKSVIDIANPADYFAAQKLALANLAHTGETDVTQIAPNVWAHKNARIAKRAKITGPAYIGANTHVMSGAKLTGHIILHEGAKIGVNAHVNDCILHPYTSVEKDAVLSGKIISPDWTIDHQDQPNTLKLAVGA